MTFSVAAVVEQWAAYARFAYLFLSVMRLQHKVATRNVSAAHFCDLTPNISVMVSFVCVFSPTGLRESTRKDFKFCYSDAWRTQRL